MSSIEPKVFFRCDGYLDIGLGHLNRCINFANVLEDEGIGCLFVISSKSQENFTRLYPNYKFKILEDSIKNSLSEYQNEESKIVVFDTYQYDKNILDDLKNSNFTCLAFDDYGEKNDWNLTGIINSSISAFSIPYNEKLKENSMIGPEFLLLRSEFEAVKRVGRKVSKDFSISITMGASDPDDWTQKIALIINEIECVKSINLIYGPLVDSEKVKNVLEVVPENSNIYHCPDNLLEIFQSSHFAITSGGTTCNELYFLGVPMMVLVQSKDQIYNARAIAELGIGSNLGEQDQLDSNEILENVKKFASNLEDYHGFKTVNLIENKERIVNYFRSFFNES
ncbi:MAG: hypothetical protein HOE90_11415 [Bacteriovoracaceae bacterium]|nr:hypothetical protein [Bacteriovoracaceae bacterium]